MPRVLRVEGAAETAETAEAPARAVDESGQITIAFAGDTHFELHLARLLDRPREALGPISRTLRRADLAMLNLESAVTLQGGEYFFTPSIPFLTGLGGQE